MFGNDHHTIIRRNFSLHEEKGKILESAWTSKKYKFCLERQDMYSDYNKRSLYQVERQNFSTNYTEYIWSTPQSLAENMDNFS